TGALWAIDRWGAFYSPISVSHTAKINFEIWVQNFRMKPGIQPKQGANFVVPVYFVKNDSFPVIRKSISDIEIAFTLSPDANLSASSIIFDSASSRLTALERSGWSKPQGTVDPSGLHVVVKASRGTGTMLASTPLLTGGLDSLVMLHFHSLPDELTRKVDIKIDSITFNRGKDSTYLGTQSPGGISTAQMPAPYGVLSGGVIVITGACAPQLITDNLHPSSVSLDPPRPNPFSTKATFEYTVSEDGPVRLAIYDVLGQQLRVLVDENQSQGHYRVSFDGTGLGSGNYVARLSASGVIRSRRIGVEK
ncbi:MAG: T9SS type A sorting domain-containing protein, partial [Ignavibacteriota bacterium]